MYYWPNVGLRREFCEIRQVANNSPLFWWWCSTFMASSVFRKPFPPLEFTVMLITFYSPESTFFSKSGNSCKIALLMNIPIYTTLPKRIDHHLVQLLQVDLSGASSFCQQMLFSLLCHHSQFSIFIFFFIKYSPFIHVHTRYHSYNKTQHIKIHTHRQYNTHPI